MGFDLPPLNGLRLFEAAARCGSFKRAAQELNLTPGAISHGINSLEQWLGVELFDRSCKLTLSSAGRHYLPYVKEALSMIAKGTSEALADDRDAKDGAGAAVRLKIGLR
jgi:LysR family transcriptional regulator, glycine cleavage system transcriptional activator